jgi:hypothetical protein
VASPTISLAFSSAGAAASAAPARRVFEVRARPAPIIKSGTGKPPASRSAGAATAVPTAIVCMGFSLACCFNVSSQPWVLRLTKSDTSDLMPCGETL